MITKDIETSPSIPAEQKTASFWSWRLILLGAAIVFAYDAVIGKLVQDWYTNPDFSHGFLVPLFSGWVLWRQRDKLLVIKSAPSWWGLPVIVGSVGLLLLGTLGAELFLSRVSLVLMLAGLVIFFSGWRMFRAVVFPWAILFFMIPIPAIIFNQITFPLQLLASKLASAILPLLGVPVFREGNVINLPAMPLEVAEACSGIRSLMSLGTMAIIYGYLLEPKMWRRIALAVASIPIAVAANAARVVGTGLCVQYWDPDKALGFFHEFSGWVIFVISLVLLFAFHRVLRIGEHRREKAL